MRITKYYFTERIVRRIGVRTSTAVIAHIATIEGRKIDPSLGTLKPAKLVAAINSLDDTLREAINAEFRNIQGVGRCTKVKPTVIQIMRNHGMVKDDAHHAQLLAQINERDLFYVAANLSFNLPLRAWQEVCLMARQLRVPESGWLTFGILPRPDAATPAPDVSDAALERLRKRICELIFTNEGRADEGWCSHFHDSATGVHSFAIDMTDHLDDKKVRFARNRFRVVPRKEVFDVLFRYKPQLGELSIRAEGPRDYRRLMCELWLAEILGGAATLDDSRHKYRLDRVLAMPNLALRVAADSAITRAEIEGVELGSSIYDDLRFGWRSNRGNLKTVVAAVAQAANIPLSELRVQRIDIRLHYLDRTGNAASDLRYLRPDASNVIRAPDEIRREIPALLELNGLTA